MREDAHGIGPPNGAGVGFPRTAECRADSAARMYHALGAGPQTVHMDHEGVGGMAGRLERGRIDLRAAVPAQRMAVRRTHPVVVSPIGPLEGPRVLLLRRRLALLSVHHGAEVVVDLAAVPSMDSRAAQAIADARARLGRRGGLLRIVNVRAQPSSALDALTRPWAGDGSEPSRRGW